MDIIIQIILFLLLTIGTASVIYFVFYYHGGIVSNIDNLIPSFNTFGKSVGDGDDDFNITYTEYNKSATDVQKSAIANNQCTKHFKSGWWGKQYFTVHENLNNYFNSEQAEANDQEWTTPSNPNSVCYTKTTEAECPDDDCIWYGTDILPYNIPPFCAPPPLQCKRNCPPVPGATPPGSFKFSQEGNKLTKISGTQPNITGDQYCGNGSGNGNLGVVKEGGKWIPKCACVNYVY